MLCITPERRGAEKGGEGRGGEGRGGEGRGGDIKPRHEHEAAKSVLKPVNMAILTGKWNKNFNITGFTFKKKSNDIATYVVLILSNNILLSPGNQM